MIIQKEKRGQTMVQNSFTLYKLVVLYLLDKVNFPLTNSQISEFILEKGYTDFLTLQQVFSDLNSGGLITSETLRNRTLYSITEEGEQTLHALENKISSGIKADVHSYLEEHEMAYRNEVSIRSDYRLLAGGDYRVDLSARDRDTDMVELTLYVPSEKIANSICKNWQNKNEIIYQYLTEQLF